MANFNPDAFMNQTMDAGSTSMIAAPEGEYEFTIAGDPEFEEFTSQKNGKTYTKMTLQMETNDPRVCETTGRSPTRVRWQAFLDLTDSGGLDMSKGKNLGLNRLREAVGLNRPGFKFSDLAGRNLIGNVKHRVDERDETRVFDEIDKVRGL